MAEMEKSNNFIAMEHDVLKFWEDNNCYEKRKENVLENISFSVQPGQTVGIIGSTGSGKTSLVQLIPRLYDVTEGQITLDGHDIKQIPLKVLRESIAYVPQDSMLFSDTIARNIAFGKHDATMDEIMEAAKDACVHENIIDFTEQYETVVGERGVTLSGGQKQRCAIARALLKESSVLILDDSLSAVDTDTEEHILRNLKENRQGKTMIIIAHRISTIEQMDKILFIEDGKLIAVGTHSELYNNCPAYQKMVDLQKLEAEGGNE